MTFLLTRQKVKSQIQGQTIIRDITVPLLCKLGFPNSNNLNYDCFQVPFYVRLPTNLARVWLQNIKCVIFSESSYSFPKYLASSWERFHLYPWLYLIQIMPHKPCLKKERYINIPTSRVSNMFIFKQVLCYFYSIISCVICHAEGLSTLCVNNLKNWTHVELRHN